MAEFEPIRAKLRSALERGSLLYIPPMIRRRALLWLEIALSILLDGMLFCVWLLIAWGVSELSSLATAHGFSPWAATAFKWFSSIATLILVIVYVIHDIYKAVLEALDAGERDNEKE